MSPSDACESACANVALHTSMLDPGLLPARRRKRVKRPQLALDAAMLDPRLSPAAREDAGEE
eukprot:10543333-Prorocentrum_lima.AAC.1